MNPRMRVLVTGAASGLGEAIALELARRNHQVVGTTRSPERAAALTRQHADRGVVFEPLELDEPDAIDRLAASLARDGGLDVLVQNAGFGIFGPVEELDPGLAERQLRINFLAPLRLARRLLPLLRERRGQIIFIGSLAGRFPLPFQADYSASKAALAAMSDALRMELRPLGVRVTCVEPGDFATSFTGSRNRALREGSAYERPARRALETAERNERGGPGAEWVARKVARLVTDLNPPARVAVGRWARTLVFLGRVMPDTIRERAIRAFSGMGDSDGGD